MEAGFLRNSSQYKGRRIHDSTFKLRERDSTMSWMEKSTTVHTSTVQFRHFGAPVAQELSEFPRFRFRSTKNKHPALLVVQHCSSAKGCLDLAISVFKNTAKMPPFLALPFRAFAAFPHSLATAMVSKTLPQKHKLYNTSPPNPRITQVAVCIKAKTYLAVVKRLFEYLG
jgi:hypothetical protein